MIEKVVHDKNLLEYCKQRIAEIREEKAGLKAQQMVLTARLKRFKLMIADLDDGQLDIVDEIEGNGEK